MLFFCGDGRVAGGQFGGGCDDEFCADCDRRTWVVKQVYGQFSEVLLSNIC